MGSFSAFSAEAMVSRIGRLSKLKDNAMLFLVL